MADRSGFWTTPPEALAGEGIVVRLLPPVPQIMVSGDLDGFAAAHGLPPPLGLLAATAGPRYALRLARNRMLAVGIGLDPAAGGWVDGAALTPMTGALAVIGITGENAMALVARATAIDPRRPSASAALMFAGATAALCRHDGGLRLHLDRGLVPWLMSWCAATDLFRAPGN
ncbi:hypothetical protein [Pseudogemmobacter humi]|uniref:Sarcosine oxidase, gamma subunit family n=1 Tax=Pseudogemmobacter humi TaxID=2483812 RepID=A0A3P5X8H4_9RHOB|nr:hypothetical protein [Pseudogemmobacter humi]VDC27529.1 hypothetical protein XINFAN_01907 [Pseudogemmobacter humi]